MRLPQDELRVIPNIIGVDINCGMLSIFCDYKHIAPEEALKKLRRNIPSSTKTHSRINGKLIAQMQLETNRMVIKYGTRFNDYFGTSYTVPRSVDFDAICKKVGITKERFATSIGTLGGGNHFIEAGVFEPTGELVFTIHSGSRNFGKSIAIYHQNVAIDKCYHNKEQQAEKDRILREEPAAIRQQLINNLKFSKLDKESRWLEGQDAFNYLIDMVIASVYAKYNRIAMSEIIDSLFKLDINDMIETVHNFINFDDMIIRKGSVAAHKDQMVIIPFNPLYGILLCEGKGNPDWNCSAPHGAGRVGPRKDFKDVQQALNFKEKVIAAGSYMDIVPTDEIDICYKDPESIVENIEETVNIIGRIKPIFTMKGKGKKNAH
jgi:RNA-splicing ligase RtcB